MTTAFVLSGGASLGAVQVGMLKAQAEAGVRPDVLVGTSAPSAGAFNAGWVAGHPDAEKLECLEHVWQGLRRQDVFPPSPGFMLAGVLGRRDHLFSADGLKALVRGHIGFRRLEQAAIPVHVVATEVRARRRPLHIDELVAYGSGS